MHPDNVHQFDFFYFFFKLQNIGARTKDTRLEVTVVGPRPWIGLTLKSEESTHAAAAAAVVVVGQLMPLLLTLTNMGDAPAKYITLSSNASVVPTNVSILSSSVTKEGKLTTVFRLPVTPLGPNETREVELTLRVPDNGVGPQDVFVMIEYSDQEDIPQDIGTCVFVYVLFYLFASLLGFFLFSSSFLLTSFFFFLFFFLLLSYPFISLSLLQSHAHYVSVDFSVARVPC